MTTESSICGSRSSCDERDHSGKVCPEWELCFDKEQPTKRENVMEIELPRYGWGRELLRKFQNTRFHGELVVTIHNDGKIELTIYEIKTQASQDLKKVTYQVF